MLTLKKDIIQAAQHLHNKNMLAAADGNISYRISHNEILITPAGKPKAQLQEKDIAIINQHNTVIQGEPSSERLMHLAIYEHCPQAKCVIHAHPVTAIAWSIARPELTELPSGCISELILAAGRIPIANYALPGTESMGEMLKPFLPDHRIIILARHGAITWGESLQEAVNGMERLEHTAEILMRAEMLGGLTFLPEKQITELFNLREKIGEKVL